MTKSSTTDAACGASVAASKSSGINRDVWLKALADIGEDGQSDPEAITTTDFMAMMHVDRQMARRRLDKLVAAGKATRTFKRERSTDGRMVRCVGYRLVP